MMDSSTSSFTSATRTSQSTFGENSKRLPLDRCFFARTEQLNIIQSCLKQQATSVTAAEDDKEAGARGNLNPGIQVILVSGSSGVGKTTLVRKAVSSFSDSMLIGMAKFDPQTSSSSPLEAIQTCVGQIVDRVLRRKQPLDEKIASEIDPEDQKILQKIIPSTSLLFKKNAYSSSRKDNIAAASAQGSSDNFSSSEHPEDVWLIAGRDSVTSSERKSDEDLIDSTQQQDHNDLVQRLQLALKRFLTFLSNLEPVVWVLDDLQWCERDSFDLLTSIFTDTATDGGSENRLILCATYRNNEVTEELTAFQDTIHARLDSNNVHSIELNCFCVHELKLLLTELLDSSGASHNGSAQHQRLAELIHQRTAGNIFFIRQLLDDLQDEHIITFDWMTLQWKYSLQQVQESTNLSDNVLQVVVKKIRRLEPRVQQLLQLCACFGTTRIQFSTLEVCLPTFPDIVDCAQELLEEACQERLLLKDLLVGGGSSSSSGWYKFSHDKVLESVQSMLPTGKERQELHAKIGRLLWKYLNDNNDNKSPNKPSSNKKSSKHLWFICADQFNLGPQPSNDQERWEHVKLNYKTAFYASRLSAYHPASRYCQAGIKALGETIDPFGKNNNHTINLILSLYVLAAEMFYCTGKMGQALEICDKVLSSKSLDHKLTIFVTKTKIFVAGAQHEEVVNFALQALKELGESVPKRPNKLEVIRCLHETAKLLKSGSDEKVLSLPLMQDPRKAVCIQLLQYLIMPIVHMAMSNLFTLVVGRVLRLTFKYGLTRWTPEVFAVAGADMIARKDDIENGYRLGQLAMALVDRLQAKSTKVMVCFWTSAFSLAFKRPLPQCLDVCMEGYNSGMRYGDIHFALHNINCYALVYFYGGMRLRPLLEDLEKYCQQMIDYKMFNALLSILPLWQCTLNLCGEQPSGALDMTTGYAVEKQEISGNKNRLGEQASWSFLMQICYYLGDFEQASELSHRLQGLTVGITRAEVFYPTRVFFFALTAIERYRSTGERKFKKEAKKHVEQMSTWINRGAINLVHKGLILRAEMDALTSKDHEAIRSQYNKAFAMAMRSGFLQDAALTGQLAALFCENHFPDLVSEYVVKAWAQWRAWDAVAVAEYLEATYPDAFRTQRSLTASIRDSSSYRSRSRFSIVSAKQHEELNLEHESAAFEAP